MSHKNIVITGGTKGIGLAIARTFASENFNLILCSRTKNDLLSVSDLLTYTYDVDVNTYAVDLGDQSSLQSFITEIKQQYSSIDILVNNAGWFVQGDIITEPDDHLQKMLNTNVIAPYYLCKYLIPNLSKSDHPHIFNIGSITTKAAIPNVGSYAISKYALKGLTTTLRHELIDTKIKVTDVIPGATYTSSWDGVDIDPDRLIDPSDVAQSILSAYNQSPRSVVEEIIIRPMKGDL